MIVTKKEGVCVCVCALTYPVLHSLTKQCLSYRLSKYRRTAHHLCDGFEPCLHHQLDCLVLAGTPTYKGVMGPELNVSLGAKDT